MTEGEKQGGLPTWAKVLIGIVVAGMIAAGALIVAGIFFVSKMSKEATDPQAIARTAAKIADFQQPLPEGYSFISGLGIANMSVVAVQHEPDGQTIMVLSFPYQKEQTATEVLDKMFDSGLIAPNVNARFSGDRTKGEMEVGGQAMPYIISTVTDDSGKDFKGILGCIMVPEKKKTVLIYGMQPEEEDYNLEITEGFLKAIKQF